MSHEPSRLVGGLEHPMKLVSRDGFLARANNEQSHEPFANRDMRTFKHRSNRHGKLFAACPAEINALANGFLIVGILRRQLGDWLALVVILAMGADRTVRPAHPL